MFSIRKQSYLLPLLMIVAGLPSAGHAQDISGMIRAVGDQVSNGTGGGAELSGRIIQLFAMMTVLSLAPGIMIMMTSFTRFVIVFSMLRSAMGLNQTPPNMVITSLAMFMTFFVMQPVFEDAWDYGLEPLLNDAITEEQALESISQPFKSFMFANVREQDVKLFRDMAGISEEEEITLESVGWRELAPAFLISELRRAFIIGALIYLPFIVIDLIVSSVLMSAGMMMLPPVMISLPFKVIFFVLVDGWYFLVGSLVESYLPYAAGA